MRIIDVGMAFIYILIWMASGFNFGRIARRYYRELKLNWPNGKSGYAFDWIVSMIWFIGSAFLLGELDKKYNLSSVELIGPLALIVTLVASLYYYRPRQ